MTTVDAASSPPTPSRFGRSSLRSAALLLTLCGAIFLEGVDIAMLNVAVPAIRSDLHLDNSTAHLVISAYVLGYGGFTLLGGRCADLFGRRRVFLAALVVFIAFSVVGGLAQDAWLLVVARLITGVAAAFMTPAGLSIITTSFAEGPERDRALVLYGATGAGGFTLGLVAGGVLSAADWRWVFFAPVLLGTLILVAAAVLVRPDPPASHDAVRFDVAGAATLTLAMVSVVLALVNLGDAAGSNPLLVAGLVAAAVALVVAFVAIERRAAAPLIRLRLLREGLVAGSNVTVALFSAAFFGSQFVLTLHLQELRGWSPVETGLAFLVMGLDLVLAPLVTPPLLRRFGTVPVVLGGLSAALVAYVLLLRLDPSWSYVELLPMLALVGVSFALAYGPLTIAATDGVGDAEQGLASGLVTTSFQFGAAAGLALVTSVMVAHGGRLELDASDHRAAMLVPALAIAAAIVVLVTAAAGRSRRSSTVPAA